MSEFEIDLPDMIDRKEDINDILDHVVELGASDLYILGGKKLFIHHNQRKIPISKRQVRNSEAYGIAALIADEGAQSHLGSGASLNPSYEYRKTITNDEGAAVQVRRRFRVNMVPCSRKGERSITITIRPVPSSPPSARDYGIEPEIIETVMKAKQGMMLMVGATGTGKSTTLAGCIRDRMEEDPNGVNLVTAEDPIEFVYDDVSDNSISTQIEVERHLPDFKSVLREMMRMHPDLILVGEIRDFETIEAALAASVSGHFLFSTLHTNSVAETLQRMVGLFPQSLQSQARLDILQALTIVGAQRLVPKIGGGVVAIREYLVFDQEIKNRLIESEQFIKDVIDCVQTRGRSMRQSAEKAFENSLIDEYNLDVIKQNHG